MRALLASVVDLCRFRRGPDNVPYTPYWLVGLLLAGGVLQAWFNQHNDATLRMVVAALVGSLAVVGVVYLLLRSRGKAERFVQTATALAAVYLLFAIVTDVLALGLPLRALRDELLHHPGQPPALTGANMLILLAVFVLGVWQLCVWVRILRRSLDTSLPGAILAFLLLLLSDWVATGLVAAALGVA